jgi:hypothetical protein
LERIIGVYRSSLSVLVRISPLSLLALPSIVVYLPQLSQSQRFSEPIFLKDSKETAAHSGNGVCRLFHLLSGIDNRPWMVEF